MKTLDARTIGELPQLPAVYVLYGASGSRGNYVAYVGLGDRLKQRIQQHLVRRDSSVVTGVAAAGLNPDRVREVWWWEHQGFEDRTTLQAAELVAFGFFEPALRSRGGISLAARELAEQPRFQKSMLKLFGGAPSGILQIPTLDDALRRIEALESEVATLQKALAALRSRQG